jgi:putative intracellular protease/amidase
MDIVPFYEESWIYGGFMKVFLYVLNGMADWEIGYLTAEINSKRYFSKEMTNCSIIKVGSTGNTILTMGGMEMTPDIPVDEMDPGDQDILVLPGSDHWMEEEHDAILQIAKLRIEQDLPVAAICGATAGLARMGALNTKFHTSNDKEYLKQTVKEYTGDSSYVEKPAVTDRNFTTASGLAAVEFTYEVIKTLGIFKADTLEAWKSLNTKRDAKSFYALMHSLEEKKD